VAGVVAAGLAAAVGGAVGAAALAAGIGVKARPIKIAISSVPLTKRQLQ
jgi:hypothetical protein